MYFKVNFVNFLDTLRVPEDLHFQIPFDFRIMNLWGLFSSCLNICKKYIKIEVSVRQFITDVCEDL